MTSLCVHTSIRTSACVNCPVEENQPASLQNSNEPIRDAPKLSKSRSGVLNPTIQQASFLPTAGVLIRSLKTVHTVERP